MGEWRCSSTILNLSFRYRWMVSIMPRPLLPPGNSLRYHLYWRLGGPQRQSGCYGEEKNLLPLPEIEPEFLGCPAHSLVAIPTAIPAPHCSQRNHKWRFHYMPLVCVCIIMIVKCINVEDKLLLCIKKTLMKYLQKSVLFFWYPRFPFVAKGNKSSVSLWFYYWIQGLSPISLHTSLHHFPTLCISLQVMAAPRSAQLAIYPYQTWISVAMFWLLASLQLTAFNYLS
jgi:hypothetical protein